MAVVGVLLVPEVGPPGPRPGGEPRGAVVAGSPRVAPALRGVHSRAPGAVVQRALALCMQGRAA